VLEQPGVNDNMRLLYLTRSWSIHNLRFLRAFDHHGLETGYISLQISPAGFPRGAMFTRVQNLGGLGLGTGPKTSELDEALEPFRCLVNAFDPDLVMAGPVHDCGYLAVKAGLEVPWVVQPWAFDLFWEAEHDPEARERAVTTLVAAQSLFADCEAVVDRCEQIAGRCFSSRFVMPWGIELDEIRRQHKATDLRKSLGLDSRLVFLCTRGLESVYGVETLVKAFQGLYRRNPQVTLVLAAEGSLRGWVEGFVEKHALAGSVLLTGAVEHERVLDFFNASDVYISCSVSDGTSISLLEAMACGLPVIVSDVFGNREWVSPGENGWLVPSLNVEACAQAMWEATQLSAGERTRIAEKNSRLVTARADWDSNFHGLVRFLQRVADHDCA
jgi:glycosyltransferase involved in cell wall biosynthesis